MTSGGGEQNPGEWQQAPPDEVVLIPPSVYEERYRAQGWQPPPQAYGAVAGSAPRFAGELPGSGDGRPRQRGLVVGVAAAVVVVLLVVALVNLTRHSTTQAGGSSIPTSAFSLSPAPTGPAPGQNGGGQGAAPLPSESCPLIRDEESHLAYRCIDNYLVQDASDTYLGIRIAMNHEVEPGWIISEGSGNPHSLATPAPSGVAFEQGPVAATPAPSSAPALPSFDQVRAEVLRRTGLALVQAYGTNPSPATLSSGPRQVAGTQGYEMVTEVSIDPAFRAAQSLKVKKERLWVVGVPTAAGVSIFMMSIPDERSDLWPKAEATIDTIRLI
jgi:hypothetical protein